MNAEKEFLPPKEAAEFLGISEDCLSRMADAGLCPQPTDLLDRVAYSRRGLVAWLERGAPVVDPMAYEFFISEEAEQQQSFAAETQRLLRLRLKERN